MPSRPPMLDTLTMTPSPRASMRGSTASVSRIGAKKLTRIAASTPAGSSAVTARRFGIAALLTSTSMPPSASQAWDASSSTTAVSARSATHIADPGEPRRQSASTAASRSRRRATSPTVAPSAANRRASAAPTPDDAPVISTRLPAGENTMGPPLRPCGSHPWVHILSAAGTDAIAGHLRPAT